MKIKIKKLVPEAKIPNYAHLDDAGMDIYALEDVVLGPNERVRVKTGIAMEIPTGFVGLVWDKSGLSTNYGLKTLAGVIDAGYRGEVQIGLINLSGEAYTIKKQDKIAQILIQKIEQPEILEVRELSATPRGEGGFGSTGKE
ncbi:MAG: dUTP diphosphatase [Candidatus Paceibacterota bacterium]|jgi:dUTP pyrophosphatase